VASAESFRSNSVTDANSKKRKTKPAPWKKLTQYVNEHKTEDRSDFTTVLLRNIPTRYTTNWLIEEIHNTGNRCNFVHMPMAKKFDINLGYAFINFITPAEALDFFENFQGHQFVKQPRSAKRAAVEFSSLQGFDANVEFYASRRVAKSKHAPWILRDHINDIHDVNVKNQIAHIL
jgi:RNA recognition motif-containing protein